MKTKQRTLALLLVLVIVLGGLLWWVNRSNAAEEAASSAAADGTIPLSAFTMSDLTQIEYTYNGETITLDYADNAWTLAQDPDYHLDTTSCDTMRTALASLNAKRKLTAQEGEDYGFDNPTVTVTVTAAGESTTLTVGAQNAVTDDFYVKKAGDDAVYTVASNKAACFELGKADLFGSFNPAGITASALEQVDYTLASGETVSLSAVSEQASSESTGESTDEEAASDSADYVTVWRLTDALDTDLDEDKVQALLTALGTYVSGQITPADGADPAACGFDTPLITVQAATADNTVQLTYASGTDGYYMMVEGDSSIYPVDGAVVTALLNTAEDLKAE